MSKRKDMQKVVRQYKDEAGVTDVDVDVAVAWAVRKGWLSLPEPLDPLKRLAREVAAALREETRVDRETGEAYRANHMYVVTRGDEQLRLWVDIDEAKRGPMKASATMRREQIVGDITQLTFDVDHWNRVNPTEAPIEVEKDFTLDVEIRRHHPPADAA